MTALCQSDGVGCLRDDCQWPEQPCVAEGEAKGDGESWEVYAHRLERRIKAQREHIKSLAALREVPGDKKARARIAHLERLVGRKEVQISLHHDGLRALNQRILELEEEAAPTDDPLEGANCHLCGATADNFHVSDDLWARVGLGPVQACFKCLRIAAWHAGLHNDGAPWEVSLGPTS